MALTWDGVGEKFFETGVDHGVLYIPNEAGVYNNGVAWNGLTNVTESPTGAEQTKTYADNIIYGVLTSVEELEGTITCYTYPPEFDEFNGKVEIAPGVVAGQQTRRAFGFSYRTRKGNDVAGDSLGYKLHLLYGCFAAPSEESHDTVNDSPEMTELSYELTSVPVPITIDSVQVQTSVLTVDSTTADPTQLAALEALLYGAAGDPQLPTPDEVSALLNGTATATNITVVAAVDAVAIGGTTTNVQFTTSHWDGDSWVVDGAALSEAATEALVLVTGTVYRVTLSPTTGFYIPAAQTQEYYVVPT